jgi:hypothetical protein
MGLKSVWGAGNGEGEVSRREGGKELNKAKER